MRTYTGFLLFEEVLDFLPGVVPDLDLFIQTLISPIVQVTEADCGTVIGKKVDTKYQSEGLIELATGNPLTKTRVNFFLAAGTYTIPVRHLHSCVTVNGICQKCYSGTYLDATIPTLGSIISLPNEYNYTTDFVVGDGTITSFTLTQASNLYTKILVMLDGVLQTSGYTVVDDTLTFAVAPANGVHILFKYYKNTGQPYIGYLAETYSGSLMGMKALPTQTLNIRPSLQQNSITDEELNKAETLLKKHFKDISSSYLQYLETIPDKLERAIYIATLYGLYANIRS